MKFLNFRDNPTHDTFIVKNMKKKKRKQKKLCIKGSECKPKPNVQMLKAFRQKVYKLCSQIVNGECTFQSRGYRGITSTVLVNFGHFWLKQIIAFL